MEHAKPVTHPTILDLTPDAARETLAAWLDARGEPAYRLQQVVPRLWQTPASAWDEATDLPQGLRDALSEAHPLPRLDLLEHRESSDGTRKFLWGLRDGESIESVLIPEGRRRTLCVSSQAGCALGCVFCATGTMGLRRHLTAGEIAAQVREIVLRHPDQAPTNVVYMGMGEPLHNWAAVDVSLTILNDPAGLRIGARHITLSTVGLLPNLAKFVARPEQFRLAISLHAARPEVRRGLMPVERRYGLTDLVRALESLDRRVTFEYVMIRGRNDGNEDALALAQLAVRVRAHVNLLPLHPGGGGTLVPTPPAEIEAFASTLRAHGVETVIRRSRGLDIAAACGQLRVEAGG